MKQGKPSLSGARSLSSKYITKIRYYLLKNRIIRLKTARLVQSLVLLILCSSVLFSAWLFDIGVEAATPPTGTLTNNSGPVTYTAGPFFVPNASAQANGTPVCNAALECDDFTLTIAVSPPITPSTHRVKIVTQWPVSAADFDVYVLQGDTGENVIATAASSSDPEVAYIQPVNGVYRIRVVPFAPAGQSFTGTISLEPLPQLPPPPPGIAPRYKNYPDPTGLGNEAGEPSIGVDWNPNLPSLKHGTVNTGGVAFFTANVNELRVSFDDCSSPAGALWEDKTSPQTSVGGLDPIGFVDHQTGRVFQSQLTGAGSILAFSDDDGETWLPSQGAGVPAGVDHQTVGGGPYNESATPPPPPHPLSPNAVYYASQDAATAFAARSDDGGLTFGAGVPMWSLVQCGGLHGHVKVAPDGTVYVPNKGCSGEQGVAVSTDNGLTWTIRTVPGSTPGDTDPSVGIGSDNTLYFGYQNGDGHPHMARSTDRGQTWLDRDVGGGFIQNCVFPEAVAGDGDRAAFGFVGTPTGGNYQDADNFHGIWHFYIATTYDRGNSYFLVDATPSDPVQIGSICTSGTTCGDDRNLLDFNDIAVDKEGRVLAAYADGCVSPACLQDPPSPSSSSRSSKATIIRQSGGRRLFAAFDPVEPAAPPAPRLISATRDNQGVTVQWDEPDSGGSPLTAYKIYRGTTSGGETFLASINPSAPRYLDATANPNTQYFYRVTAMNSIGEGVFCGEVEVTAAPPAPDACSLPGILITTDPAGDQTGDPATPQLDIRQISIGEPFLNKCTNQLVFTMKVADLSVVPPQARWTIFFSRASGTEYFVSMNSDDTGNPTGVTFKYGHTMIGTGGVRQLTTDGDADPESTFSADGTITIVVSNSKLTFNLTPPPATLPPPAPGDTFGNVNAITQQTIGVLLATIDSTASGGYTLVGNRSCQPNTAPIASMLATPTTGTAPLMVNFDGSASSDSDMCDTVLSYTFDFGDGSAPVTQASPTISHTYDAAGEYGAKLRVTDSRGKLSDNTAITIIEVESPEVANSISGTISYCIDNSKKVPNATVQTTSGSPSASTSTNASGFYQLDDLGTGPYTVAPSKTGAVSGISAQDIGILRRLAAGIDTPTPCQSIAGDTDNNGSLGGQDIGFLRRFVAQLSTTGITGSWKFSPASRSYPSLVSNQTNQDYDALLIGDVDGNWTPAAPDPASFQKSQAPSATNLALSLPSVVAPPGSTDVSIPVMVNGTLTNGDFVLGYTIEISFDPSVLVPHSPSFNTTGTVSSTGVVTENTGVSGRLRLVVDFQNPLIFTGQQTLIILRFDVVGTQGQMSGLNWFFTEFGSGPPAVTTTTTNGNFTVSTPTAAKVDAFTATGYDKGVYLLWQTGFEADNLGFNIYRQQGGQMTRVTPEMLAGSALVIGSPPLTAGRVYSWWDNSPDSKQDALYYLEDIDINGKRSLHGPLAPVKTGDERPPERSQAAFLSTLGEARPLVGLSRQVESSANVLGAKDYSIQSGLASGSAIKLSVNHEGWYRLTQPDLVRAGLDPNVDPRLLQLFVDGRQLPIIVQGQEDARFDPSDTVEFYGQGLDTPATDTRVYWLVGGSQFGDRIATLEGSVKPVGSGSFSYTIERRDRTIYFSSLKNGEQENFFGPVITASQPVDQSLVLQRLDTSASAVLEVAVQGVTLLPHQVSVTVNGAVVGVMSFNGRAHEIARFQLSAGMLSEGHNEVSLISQSDAGDVSLVDYVRLTYSHTYKAEDDALRFTAQGNQSVTISGFSNSQIRVVDITDPNAPQALSAAIQKAIDGYSISLRAPGSSVRTLLAIAEDRVESPAAITANQPSNWKKASNGADFIIITRREFFASLEPLKTLRQSQKLVVALVDIEDVYDEFSYGHKTPQAIKDFLAFASTNWKRKPRFVMFAADASFDARNYLGYGNWDLVPSKLIDTEFLETASDDWLADFNNDGLADLSVGRLPARTSDEAALMAGKIIAYERSGSSRSALLVADSNDVFDFEGASSGLRAMLPSYLRVQEIKRSGLDPQTAKGMLLDGINQGQTVVNYLGHGSVNLWRGNLLESTDARLLVNQNNLAMFLDMTCLNGYFQDPSVDSLAESLMKAEHGGAVAVWASSGETGAESQAAANREMLRLIFSSDSMTRQPITLGEAARRAKAAVADPDVRLSYILFGDPSMRLR